MLSYLCALCFIDESSFFATTPDLLLLGMFAFLNSPYVHHSNLCSLPLTLRALFTNICINGEVEKVYLLQRRDEVRIVGSQKVVNKGWNSEDDCLLSRREGQIWKGKHLPTKYERWIAQCEGWIDTRGASYLPLSVSVSVWWSLQRTSPSPQGCEGCVVIGLPKCFVILVGYKWTRIQM